MGYREKETVGMMVAAGLANAADTFISLGRADRNAQKALDNKRDVADYDYVKKVDLQNIKQAGDLQLEDLKNIRQEDKQEHETKLLDLKLGASGDETTAELKSKEEIEAGKVGVKEKEIAAKERMKILEEDNERLKIAGEKVKDQGIKLKNAENAQKLIGDQLNNAQKTLKDVRAKKLTAEANAQELYESHWQERTSSGLSGLVVTDKDAKEWAKEQDSYIQAEAAAKAFDTQIRQLEETITGLDSQMDVATGLLTSELEKFNEIAGVADVVHTQVRIDNAGIPEQSEQPEINFTYDEAGDAVIDDEFATLPLNTTFIAVSPDGSKMLVLKDGDGEVQVLKEY